MKEVRDIPMALFERADIAAGKVGKYETGFKSSSGCNKLNKVGAKTVDAADFSAFITCLRNACKE